MKPYQKFSGRTRNYWSVARTQIQLHPRTEAQIREFWVVQELNQSSSTQGYSSGYIISSPSYSSSSIKFALQGTQPLHCLTRGSSSKTAQPNTFQSKFPCTQNCLIIAMPCVGHCLQKVLPTILCCPNAEYKWWQRRNKVLEVQERREKSKCTLNKSSVTVT